MMSPKSDKLIEDDADTGHFLDRSKVRILLCDNDAKSCHEALELLCKCSYQVTAVKTPRQVFDALNAEGQEIDIILSEIDLPVNKGLKMLKYITREKDLHRIPIVSTDVHQRRGFHRGQVLEIRGRRLPCVVKPLRTNELLNLWTHMWRRRKMLRLSEKNILHEIDLLTSDRSDTNTNSTNLFSDDTDELNSRRNAGPEANALNRQECDSSAVSLELQLKIPLESGARVSQTSSQPGVLSCPKGSKLKVGESSAFFTYMRSNVPPANTAPGSRCSDKDSLASELLISINKNPTANQTFDDRHNTRNGEIEHDSLANRSNLTTLIPKPNFSHGLEMAGEEESGSLLSSTNHCKVAPYNCTPHWFPSNERGHGAQLYSSNPCNHSVVGHQQGAGSPIYVPGMLPLPVPSSNADMFQVGLPGRKIHAAPGLMHSYSGPSQWHVPLMAPISYPLGLSTQATQMQTQQHGWVPTANSLISEVKPDSQARREAALIKFRNKRKDRCFDKKVRYVNRKLLAENRPRIRGQFVRQADDENHSSGHTAANEFGVDEDDDEPFSSELGADSAPGESESEF